MTALRLKRCCIAVLLAAVSAGVAGAVTVDEVLARMEESERKITAVSFDFTQEISYTLTKEKQTNAGDAVYQKPNNLYLKQKSPLEQVIISNGKKVWIYTPTYKQVLVDTWKKWMQSSMVPSSMLNFGQNYDDLKKQYAITLAGTEEKAYVLLLTPRTKDGWQLKLWIDQDSLTPSKAVLFAENITITTNTLNYRINPQVDKSRFTFQAPPGVETLNIP